MTDRGPLEKAAKAAGLVVEDWITDGGAWVYPAGSPLNAEGEPPIQKWNPLTDDGDALRLAVHLGLIVEVGRCWRDKQGPMYGEDVLPCAYAATRRAIVRAAAAIGEQA